MYIEPSSEKKYLKKVKVFKILAGIESEQNVALEQLLNSTEVEITKIETEFDRDGNYVVAVWYDEVLEGVK